MTVIKANLGAELCERVCLTEAEWLTWVFTLCPLPHTVWDQTNKNLLIQTKFTINELLTDLSVTVRLAQTFISWHLFWFTAVFLSNNTQFWPLCFEIQTLQSTGRAAREAGQYGELTTIDSAAVPSLTRLQSKACIHPQLSNAPTLCCQWKIPLQIPHAAKSYREHREPRQHQLTSYQHTANSTGWLTWSHQHNGTRSRASQLKHQSISLA